MTEEEKDERGLFLEYASKHLKLIMKRLEWKKGIGNLYECAALSNNDISIIEPLVNLEGHELRYHDEQYNYLVGRAPLKNWELSPVSLIRYKDDSCSVAVILFIYNLRWRHIIERRKYEKQQSRTQSELEKKVQKFFKRIRQERW